MRAGFARFLEHRDRQRLAASLLLQLRQPERRGQPRRPAADDQDVDFERVARHRVRGPAPLAFLQFADERRRNLEDVALNAVVGDLENRRLGVLVDGDDGARALHADQMLNRARDAERDVQLRRHRLTRAANLALHRQPAVVADRPRRRELGAKRLGELLGDGQVLLAS